MKSDTLALLENAAWPVLLVDGGGRIRHVNRQAAAVFGAVVEGDRTLLATIWSADNGPKSEAFVASLARTPMPQATVQLQIKGGQTQEFAAQLCPVTISGERLHLFQLLPASPAPAKAPAAPTNPLVETSLIQKQKLDCALQLARTVALDFNNQLTIILGHASHLLEEMAPDDPSRKPLMEMERSAERAAEIAADLAAFSRQDKEQKAHAAGNLNVLLRHTCEVFQTKCGPEMKWELDLEQRLYATHADEAKLQQAISRVVENAVEAVGSQGIIKIRSRNVDLQDPDGNGTAQLAAGHYVCVGIEDSGGGIAPATLPRIFEPFFSTKEGHRGLGLAWVYGIVTNHGGSIDVQSTLGAGTTIRLHLPATKRTLADSGASKADLRGTQSVLIVDDEELILTLGQTVLTAYGYAVQTATTGAKALKLLAEATEPVQLVITDMVMPGMSGRELIDKIHRDAPAVKVLACSGYARPQQTDDDLYLQKPFTTQQLLTKVKQVLG